MPASHFNVSIFTFPGVHTLLPSVPFAVFRVAQALAPGAGIAVQAFAAAPGRVRLDAADALELDVRYGPEILESTDLVLVPSWYGIAASAPHGLTRAIHHAYTRGALIAGFGLGVFLLAQSALLHDRRTAVMRGVADEFARQFPHARVVPGAAYVRDGRIVTSAGRLAAVDCCLALVKGTFGNQLADQVADHLNHSRQLPGLPYAQAASPQALSVGDRRVSQLVTWLEFHFHQQTTVDALARRARMTPRTFTRHFHALTGMTPNAWLLRTRVERAKALLLQSTLGVGTIARATGFRTTAALRKQFRAAVGTSPSEYRTAESDGPHDDGQRNNPPCNESATCRATPQSN